MRRHIIILLMAGCTAVATAQNRISLNNYRNEVIAYSYNLKISDASQAASEELSRAAYKAFLPQLSAAGDFSLNFREERAMRGSEMKTLQPYSFSLQPQVVQTIYGGGVVRNNYRQSVLQSRIAQLSSQYTMLEVIYAAEYAYWNLAANTQYLAATQQYVETITSLRGVISERFDDGYISKSDLLMIDVRLEEAKYSLVSAMKNYKSALSNFNILMGTSHSTEYTLDDNVFAVAQLPQRMNIETTLSQRPDFEAQLRQIEISEYSVKLAKAPYNPQLSVGVSGMWKNNTPNFNNTTKVDGYAFARLSVPIFSWGERRRNVAAARYGLLRTEFQSNLMADNISNEEYQAWIAIVQSAEQVGSSERSLRTGRENLDLSTFSYNEGQLSILDVLSAQVSWLQLYTNAITAGYNNRVAIAQYRLSTGTLP